MTNDQFLEFHIRQFQPSKGVPKMKVSQTTIDALADVIDADKCREALAISIATGIHNTAIRGVQDAIAALPVNPHAESYRAEVIATLQGLIK